jgi:hypothetical protein
MECALCRSQMEYVRTEGHSDVYECPQCGNECLIQMCPDDTYFEERANFDLDDEDFDVEVVAGSDTTDDNDDWL